MTAIPQHNEKLTKKQGLQKLSDSRLMRLLKHKTITQADVDKLTPAEKKRFGELSTEYMNKLTPVQRDKFMEKIKDVIGEETITGMWEFNHNNIMYAISSLMQDKGRMPTRTEIAELAKVSRNTVYKHLKDYATHPLYQEQMEKFRFLSSRVLAEVCKSALAGDTGSQKLYFNVLGMLGDGNGQKIRTQNNYIQINGMVVSQDEIKGLAPDKLAALENILKSAITQ